MIAVLISNQVDIHKLFQCGVHPDTAKMLKQTITFQGHVSSQNKCKLLSLPARDRLVYQLCENKDNYSIMFILLQLMKHKFIVMQFSPLGTSVQIQMLYLELNYESAKLPVSGLCRRFSLESHHCPCSGVDKCFVSLPDRPGCGLSWDHETVLTFRYQS